METGVTTNRIVLAGAITHTLKTQAKSERFDVDDLQDYALSVCIGIRDLQIAITDIAANTLLLLEDYQLEGVKSVNTRISSISKLFEDHPLLEAGFWSNVKVCLKTHKFALIPKNIFTPEGIFDYLTVNSEIRTKSEDVKYYRHLSTNAVNVFAADKKLLNWIESKYPSQSVQLVHQGSALIEGILKYDDHSHEKTMFTFFDHGILHVIVTLKREILYYNQFAVRESQDYLRFIMLVFKELRLSQKSTKLIIWGNIRQNSPHIELVRKYIRNISLGEWPTYLQSAYEFDEIPDHHYFDLLNIYLCD